MKAQGIPFPGLQLRDDIRRASLKLARAYVAEVLQVSATAMYGWVVKGEGGKWHGGGAVIPVGQFESVCSTLNAVGAAEVAISDASAFSATAVFIGG